MANLLLSVKEGLIADVTEEFNKRQTQNSISSADYPSL